MKTTGFAIAALLTLAGISGANASPLDVALPYNYFVLGNFTASGDITGRIAVGGLLNANGLTIGDDIGKGTDPYSLAQDPISVYANSIAGGSYNIDHGSLYAGSGSASVNYNGGGSKLASCGSQCIDFAAASAALTAYSAQLGALTQTGTVGTTVDPTNPNLLALVGTSSTLNVFTLTADQLKNRTIDLIVPTGATTVVNVTGTSITGTQGGLYINGKQYSGTQSNGANILFNFPTATSVAITSQFSASILAPLANYSGTAQVDGNVIVGSVTSTGETHDALFTGSKNLPPPTSRTPEPSTTLLMAAGGLVISGWKVRRNRRGGANLHEA